MRRVGNDDVRPLVVLAAVAEVRVEEHQPCELALAPRSGLKRHGIEAGHLEQDLLQVPLELEGALRGVILDERMELREPRQPDEPLVDPRVVFHRAAAERVEARVDPEVARRELREMAQHLRLGKLGQARRILAPELGRHVGHLEALGRPRHADPTAPRLRLLVDQLHDSASTSNAISSTVRLSVTATRSVSSRPG